MKENDIRKSGRFRNHISIILEQTGAVIAAAFVLVVTQLFQSIDELTESDLSFITSKGFLILLGVIALLAVSLTGQVIVWAKTYISIEENAIVIEKGSVNKKKNTIGIRNISNINLEQNLIEMLFGTCKVKLDTNSRSTADSTDVKIVLKKPDALWFQQEVTRKMEEAAGRIPMTGADFRVSDGVSEVSDKIDSVTVKSSYAGETLTGAYSAGREPEDYDVRAGIADILQHGFFSISIFSVVIFLLVIVGTVMSVAEVIGRAGLMASLAGSAAGIVVAAFIILSTLWDTVKDFVRYYDFRAKRLDDKIYIKYGFFKKVEYTIPVDKIQALKIRQSLLARIGHRYMAEIVNVGMGDDKEEQHSFLVLYCTEEKLGERLSLLLPEFASCVEQRVDRLPASVWAAWTIPTVVYILVVVGSALMCNELVGSKYRLYIWIVSVILILFLLIGMILKYRTAGVGADERYLKIAGGYFARQYLSVQYRNIQYAEFSQNFIARACGIKKGEIHLLASSANTAHTIPYFSGDKDEIVKRKMLLR